ncbi:hypothetical protein [Virgibacillus kimchii]
MWNDIRNKKHLRNVRKETDNPAILNDVIDSGMEQEQNESPGKGNPLSPLQEIVRNNTDGKTWQNVDE